MKPGKDHPAWLHKAMAEGGWVGEGDSGRPMKENSAELRDEAKTASNVAKGLGAASLGSFGAMVKSRSLPRALAAGYGAMGTGAATLAASGRSLLKHSQADEADKEANEAEGRPSRAKGGWIKNAIKKPGALRAALHAKKGEPIPAKKLAKAAHSDNPKLAKRARLAQTLKKMHG